MPEQRWICKVCGEAYEFEESAIECEEGPHTTPLGNLEASK